MNPEVRGRMTITDQGDALVLAGAIDEAAALHELPTRARNGHLVLDLAAITDQGDALVLAGAIDEAAALHELPTRARNGALVLDLAAITFINSLGVRDWIRMQAAAQQGHLAVELRRVAEPLVHQLNMIIATRGTATVTSFFAPYACDACGREESLLIDAVANADRLVRLEPPPMTCPECKSQMAFNDFPERYFSFLTS